MSSSFRPRLVLSALTMVMWVVPSVGTQGMGTIGQRFNHPDAALFDDQPGAREAARTALRRADAVTEAALGL